MIGWALVVGALAAEVDGAAELRVVETIAGPMPLSDGELLQWGPALDTRLRLGGQVRSGDVRAAVEGDVLSGQLLGGTWDLPEIDERGRHGHRALTLAGVVPRKALVGGRTPWFDVELGLTTSQWGLGVVANDGSTDPLFGRADFGDRVLRARIATAPFARGEERFPLVVLLAGDRVVADDLARWSHGDHAWQGIAAALFDDTRPLDNGVPGTRRLGLYGVRRLQERDGRHTHVWVLDAFADWTLASSGGPSLRLAAEGALIVGTTEASRTYLRPEALPVRQAGFATQSTLRDGKDLVALHLHTAYASGDSAADDDRVTDFRFDRDYGVGMVLFREVIGNLDLAAYRQATDPSLSAHPPDGVDTLAAEGAFHAAFALQPAVEVAPLPFARVAVGGVLAWSTSPVGQAVESFRNGGAPTNHLGRPTSGRWLGSELAWAVSTDPDAFSWVARPSFALQVGRAWPSRQLSAGDPVDHVLFFGRVQL